MWRAKAVFFKKLRRKPCIHERDGIIRHLTNAYFSFRDHPHHLFREWLEYFYDVKKPIEFHFNINCMFIFIRHFFKNQNQL